MTPAAATALIAEDEPLLAAHLQAELARCWPELAVVANVGHGAAAVESALALRPDILFLDIRMPGLTGLEAAQALAEDWPDAAPFPLLVFVTAYDQYAVQAFERAAVDYVLKPVLPERLRQTCTRLRVGLEARRAGAARRTSMETSAASPASVDAAFDRLRRLLAEPGLVAGSGGPADAGDGSGRSGGAPRLAVIQAGVGATVHLVPIGDVVYFEAADKYVRVVTAHGEHLIRTALRELLPQLDPERFWQIHRGTVVRADAVATAVRDDAGKVVLGLRGHPDRLVVSRLYAHRFKAM